jgi:hypothetical protein
MKIKYTRPFDITQTPIEVDTETDFIKRSIGTHGITESNKFLISLWNQLNTEICPKHSIGRVPWAYFPGKYRSSKGNVAVSVIGFADTRIGELYFALMYKKKGDIDSLLYMCTSHKLHQSEINIVNQLISLALEQKDNTQHFICEAQIDLHLQSVSFASYESKVFSLSANRNGVNMLRFNVDAIDKFEAEQIALNKLYDVCAFLTIETNVLCTFDNFQVTKGLFAPNNNDNNLYANDYIDYFPMTNDYKLCISKYGLMFLNKYIFINDRFEDTSAEIRHFLSACKHCQIGLGNEIKVGEKGFAALPTFTFALIKRDNKRKCEHITSALMSYLSAVECATAANVKHETCKQCGAAIYKISQRVKDLATEYLGEYLGKVFHKLYEYRSKFLHEGKFVTDLNSIRTIPLISTVSVSGLVEYENNISIQVDSKEVPCAINNVKEWTFYMLRSYYQKVFMERKEFANVFQDSGKLFSISDLPLTIHSISPDGEIIMKRSLVFTNTFSYKLRKCVRTIVNNIKYFIYKRLKKGKS